MPTLEINGAACAFTAAGHGADVLVLVHGHPFDRSMWAPQIESAEAAGWRVIAPDLRGYGASAVQEGTVTLDVFARDVVELMRVLGVERAVFGGLSMGGQIVMEIARLAPERVRGLVLAATFPRAETAESRVARLDMAERFLREGMAGYADEMLTRMMALRNVAALPRVAEHVLRMMRGTDPRGAAAAMRGRAERPDYAPTLAALDVPALIVVGDEDAFTTRADAEHMRALLKRSELVWLEGCGHMPNLERTAAFDVALQQFLSGIAKLGPTSSQRVP